jgi:hypothetical protein
MAELGAGLLQVVLSQSEGRIDLDHEVLPQVWRLGKAAGHVRIVFCWRPAAWGGVAASRAGCSEVSQPGLVSRRTGVDVPRSRSQ